MLTPEGITVANQITPNRLLPHPDQAHPDLPQPAQHESVSPASFLEYFLIMIMIVAATLLLLFHDRRLDA